ncbi:hypothetical protein AAVH_27932 [Aphelenchoides avenae]|nr:hypothetical protein AAVH_27932 [Aphelenchus avenae]
MTGSSATPMHNLPPRAPKRTGANAGLESPANNIQPPSQLYSTVKQAVAQATSYCDQAAPTDSAAPIIKLLATAVSLLLDYTQKPVTPPSDFISAAELERQRSVVIAGLPELATNATNKARDNSERDAVFTLIDQLQPPDGSQPAPEVSVPCVYRLGAKNTDGRPRLLKVVFATRSMQRSVLSAAKFLRGLPDYADVYVRPSLTPEERLREYNLRKECRARRELGEKSSLFL